MLNCPKKDKIFGGFWTQASDTIIFPGHGVFLTRILNRKISKQKNFEPQKWRWSATMTKNVYNVLYTG